ncbi:MAG TPA: hypothetical protein VNF74_03755 [Terriglobales bacterium]|nr:hypothetical protein [Terriglobales bacterium]
MTPRVQALPCGSSATRRHSEDRILAVVRGRLRVELAQAPNAPPAWLRSSDALAIPARTAYTIEALQDTEIFLYADRSSQSELWGV